MSSNDTKQVIAIEPLIIKHKMHPGSKEPTDVPPVLQPRTYQVVQIVSKLENDNNRLRRVNKQLREELAKVKQLVIKRIDDNV